MRVDRFYTTPDGGSAFDELVIPLDQEVTDRDGNTLHFSEPFASPAVRIYEAPAGTFQDWHNAPTRQLCVMVAGVWEVGTTDGQTRRWGPGELFLPDTVEGRGHTSAVIEGPVRMFFLPLPPELDLARWRGPGQ